MFERWKLNANNPRFLFSFRKEKENWKRVNVNENVWKIKGLYVSVLTYHSTYKNGNVST